MNNGSKAAAKMTAGLDPGDNYGRPRPIATESGEVLEEGRLRTTPEAPRRRFGGEQPLKIAIEAGIHPPRVSRLLKECGHEVLVANARKIRLIYGDKRKTGGLDARKLARLAGLDPDLLYPVEHRGEDSQAHPALIHSRDALVRSRTQLIDHVRGTVKSFGVRLPKRSAETFHKKVAENRLPGDLAATLEDIVATIASLAERIGDYERRMERVRKERYPEQTGLLRQVPGVGPLTSLTFVLTLEDPDRFEEKPDSGGISGLGARQRPIRRAGSRQASLRGRRPDAAAALGLKRPLHPLHPGTIWPGPRPTTLRREDCRTWRKKRQKTSRGGGRP